MGFLILFFESVGKGHLIILGQCKSTVATHPPNLQKIIDLYKMKGPNLTPINDYHI